MRLVFFLAAAAVALVFDNLLFGGSGTHKLMTLLTHLGAEIRMMGDAWSDSIW